MIHRYHPNSAKGDPEDAILWDDCPECTRKALYLIGLDDHNARKAVDLMLAVERGDKNGSRRHYATRNERELCSRISTAWLLIERAGYL